MLAVSARSPIEPQGSMRVKQTRITIRQDKVVILQGQASSRKWCPICRAMRDMVVVHSSTVEPETSATVSLERLGLHRLQADDGSPIICVNSLLEVANNKPAFPRQIVEQKKKELP